jgi:UDP-glucose 4-epimerase
MSRGDLSDLVDDVDAVFHLAAEPGVRTSWGGRFDTYLRNNILATQHLLEAMRQTDPRPLVFASSSSVYGDTSSFPTGEDALVRPYSPYGVTKLAAEQLCMLYHRNFGVPSVALRLFTVYGPRQRPDMAFTRFLSAAVRDDAIQVFGDGHQGRDFTYVDDVVAAMLAAAATPEATGKVLNVGAGSPIELRDVFSIVESLVGRPLRIEHRDRERGDVRRTAADITAIQETLNWQPSMALAEGLEAQFAWMKSVL